MKKVIVLGLILTMTLSLAACGNKEKNADKSDGKKVLNVWSTTEEIEKFEVGFEEKYPELDIKIQVLSNDDYLTKLTNTVKSGQNAPDVFTAESDYVKKLVETDFMEDLSQSPYNFDNSSAGLWDYIVEVGTDSNGAIKALSWQAAPGGFIYRTDLAEQILGIKTPEEMSALLQAEGGMKKTAEELAQNDIKMFASWQDLLNMEFSNRETAWVEDGKLMIDPNMEVFMDFAKECEENKYALNTVPWDGEWIAAVNDDTCFGYMLPTWGYQYVVKANAEATSGQWGLAMTPTSYVKGGTWMGIYSGSEEKEDAWKFIEYVNLNKEAQKEYAQETSEYMSLKEVDMELASESGDEMLGGQNLYEFYNLQMEQEVPDLITEYDGTINEHFLAATKMYTEGKSSKEEAIQQFKDDVKNAYPDLAVE